MIYTYKYLLRPSENQGRVLDFLLWQSRLVYNTALEQRIQVFRETKKGISYLTQWAYFRDLRHLNPDTLGKLNATSVQQLLRRLDKAFQAFYRRVKAVETPAYPRFKGRNRFKSMEYTYGNGCKLRQNENGRKSFYIQNVGEIRMCYHRALPVNACLKHVVIKQVNRRWYACLMFEHPNPNPIRRQTPKQVGVDIGLKHLVALSSGELFVNPRWLSANLAELRRIQRHIARQIKGSSHQRKTYTWLASVHEKISNQRRDFLHKICADYDLIAIEKMSLAFMNRNRYLSRSSYDAGLGELRQILEYKAVEAGTRVIAVDPFRTTQICSGCGREAPKGLSDRVHRCPHCGLILDRDVNAARNILSRALALQDPPGRGGRAQTRAVTPYVA